MSSIQKLKRELTSLANKPQAAILQRFFKTGPGQYGAGDRFLGLKVPLQRQIAQKYGDLDWKGLQELLASKIHEFRLVALLILVAQYERAQDLKDKKNIVDFYLSNVKGINNWDLVDLSVYKILGDFLSRQEDFLVKGANVLSLEVKQLLDKLAESTNLWERRMSIVATYAFIKAGRSEETFRLAGKLLKDEHDLIHKAVGWMLREAGKRVSEKELLNFLDKNYLKMPKTALRYAVERLRPAQRERYLVNQN
ncbi:MAG: DNA alkylation repair protein [Patescibacteria group bacterium]